MTFQQAESELKALLPMSILLTLSYEKQIWLEGFGGNGPKARCGICFVHENNKYADSFYAPTWAGVIDAVKIFVLPKGEPVSEEAPDEPPANEEASNIGQQHQPVTKGGVIE